MASKRVISVFTLNRLQGHWILVDYYTLMHWTRVPVVVQCQSDGCSLYSKDVVWQSFKQLVAGCLTILEMAVDSHYLGGGGGGGGQFGIDLCRGHGCLYLEPNGRVGGRHMPPLPFGLGAYKYQMVWSNSCRAWCTGLSITSFQIVMHI